MNPVIFGIAIVGILVFWLMSFFVLGKIIGAAIIVFALMGWMKGFDPRWVIGLVVLGIFVYWNPFAFEALQFVR